MPLKLARKDKHTFSWRYLSFILLYFNFWTILVHWSFDDSSYFVRVNINIFIKILTHTTSGPPVVVRVPAHLFSLPLVFTLHWWPPTFPILSPPLENFHVVLPTKKCLICFLSLALDLQLCRPFSRWASLACRLLFLFLGLSPALYSKFVHTTINLN